MLPTSLALALLGALRPPPAQRLDRRAALCQATGAVAAASVGLFQPLPPALAISATTMTGKSKPELGVILVDEVKASKTGVVGNVVLADGLAAAVSFDTEWPLAEGGYYDVEAKSRDGGDAAFVQVAKVPGGKALANLPKSFFTDTVLSVDGRYGAYGAPTDVKVLKEIELESGGARRQLEMTFTALSPGSAEVPRRGVLAAVQPAGSRELVMLFASTGAARWKKGGKEEAMRAVDSFAVTTRTTELQQVPSSDYRFGKTSGPSNMRSRSDGF